MKTGKSLVCGIFIAIFALTFAGCDNGGGTTTPTTFTVTFNLDGGNIDGETANVQRTVNSGETVASMPANPSKADNAFGGWYTQQNGAGTPFDSSTTVTADITVYAKWSAIPPGSHKVTFVTNDGTPVNDQTVTTGGKVDPVSTTRDGYTLAGWYTEETFETEWDFATDTVSAAITLYAKWEPAIVDPPEINEIAVTGATPVGGKYRYTDTLTLGGNAEEAGVTYAWTYETDPAGKTLTFDQSAASPTIGGFEKDVKYIFKLTITDEATELVSDEKRVEIVIAGNVAPEANISATVTDVSLEALKGNKSIALQGSASDSDGNIASYSWRAISAPGGVLLDSISITHSSPILGEANISGLDAAAAGIKKAGTYKFELTVTDNDGVSDVKEVTVVVSPYQVQKNVEVAAVSFGGGSELKFKVDGGVNNNYSLVGGVTNDFLVTDLSDITYTLSSTNPVKDLSAYSNGNVPSSEYADSEYPTITQTFYYNGQIVGSRKVVAFMGPLGFVGLFEYKPTEIGGVWYDSDFTDNIDAVPATTLNNLKKDITELP